MKFPKFQHDRILKVITGSGFDLQDFFLVKRKGWIRVEYLGSDSFFTYFKKKETRITDRGEWEHLVYFKIKTEKGEMGQESSFDTLMERFDAWISNLN